MCHTGTKAEDQNNKGVQVRAKTAKAAKHNSSGVLGLKQCSQRWADYPSGVKALALDHWILSTLSIFSQLSSVEHPTKVQDPSHLSILNEEVVTARDTGNRYCT